MIIETNTFRQDSIIENESKLLTFEKEDVSKFKEHKMFYQTIIKLKYTLNSIKHKLHLCVYYYI